MDRTIDEPEGKRSTIKRGVIRNYNEALRSFIAVTNITGSGNGAIVLALRGGRQEGGRRARRTTTSTTTTTTSTTKSTTTSSSTLISFGEDVAQPAALLAPEEETWSVSSSTTSNLPFSFPSSGVSTSYARPVSTRPHLELVVKPHSKVILPCELEGNYSRLLLSGSRSYRIHGNPAVWLHEGNPVDMLTINTRTEMSGTGHRYIGDSTTAALHIDNVRLEDDGMWECTLEHDQEEFLLGRPIKLVVLVSTISGSEDISFKRLPFIIHVHLFVVISSRKRLFTLSAECVNSKDLYRSVYQ
ncbi:irregular chiasm C-roughest protein isoform X1 [Vespula maculifrons]|uniref:Irregular chiasm C-roughest protein isoform X1 n=1 Tax=Vespula maculifrons TaxID=7453 RepID=A0ABD2CRT8_VESMC